MFNKEKYTYPIQNQESKVDSATRGERSIPLGPIHVTQNGSIWNPEKGKLWPLGLWNNKDNGWPGLPQKENYICWHDTYEFIGIPWGIAMEYNENKNSFVMYSGHFCSPNCALSYLRDTSFLASNLNISTYTWMFFKKVMQLDYNHIISRAPPREILKRFQPITGLNINEYRKKFTKSKITILPKNMVSSVTLIEEIKYKRENNENREKRIKERKKNITQQKRKRIELKKQSFSSRHAIVGIKNNNNTILNMFNKHKKLRLIKNKKIL